MIEQLPDTVKNAFFYFHSAGTTSAELTPYMARLTEQLPDTYIWAGDGPISTAPLMRQGLHYGDDPKRYWFTFPMQDASSPESFAANVEAMGATLSCAGAYVNALVDQTAARFSLPPEKIVLCGYQHGGCVALAAAMQRRKAPYATTIIFEPYLLEAYYLQHEQDLPQTDVVCIDNEAIRTWTKGWIGIETDVKFQGFGINARAITVPGGERALDAAMMDAAIQVMQGV